MIKFNLNKDQPNNEINPTNKYKNKGISLNEKGIKNLKFSSKVKER